VVELEDSEQEMQRKGRVRLQLFMEGEGDFIFGDADNLRAMEESSGDDIEDLPRLGPEDASEMNCLIAGQSGGIRGPMIGNPAAACHGWSKLVEIAEAFKGIETGKAPWW